MQATPMIAIITALFSFTGASVSLPNYVNHVKKPTLDMGKDQILFQNNLKKEQIKSKVEKLAGPYAHMVRVTAESQHVSPVLAAAVVFVENGGDFNGSTQRVSSGGAIGVMQLEPATAAALHVNPWQAKSNIQGGIHFLSMMLKKFDNNKRLALMAYNAGPTLVANGGRPYGAVQYAQKVLRVSKLNQYSMNI